MKTWDTIIVDDEPLARWEMQRLLEPFGQIRVVGEAASVAEANELINRYTPDLLFLDIDLGTQTGFDLIDQINKKFHVIFVTAYDEYAIRAFQVNALDYLLKPVNPERLNESISRLGHPHRDDPGFLLKPQDRLLISQRNASCFIRVADISIIEARGDYTFVYTQDGKTGLTHQTMKRWMERLPADLFLQVHRSYIINLEMVSEVIKKPDGNSYIIMKKTANEIPVSRTQLSNIRKRFLPG
ncbi:MAG: LytTR family DNA-binding domain-containing protein [Bacteroidales bacterium]|nr:LytTR family DNA-binding domain-containing protein [Bacteroidales bacterium]MCF8345215.1 LytTR family DNA-binding domain-containing protein [Bacteroidales bacterium]MCF8351848.1 LytTR family DNA-binding domain-containing protein [Bacteroidales bacterium]MCF8375267.1 LytTR family DNA-binding domain-containing protein [Bacteroidales bacterium]MCF8401259.1 LytTR family DNA-binding domain-containing protein [Bacteroidales bacterium]